MAVVFWLLIGRRLAEPAAEPVAEPEADLVAERLWINGSEREHRVKTCLETEAMICTLSTRP